jgi:hypothetical protein
LGIFVAGLLKSSRGLSVVFSGIVGILIIDALMLICGYFLFLKRDLQKASTLAAATAPAL